MQRNERVKERSPMPRHSILGSSILPLLLVASLFAQHSTESASATPYVTRFVSVDKNVRLEVLDWGGTGRPIVLLAGGGNTAHVFDDFAPKLQALTHDHVYAITRRGFGASGYEAISDPANRLGEDVLAVIESLKLRRPILVGHSIAGAEISWVANNQPDRIAGVIYLEAGYSYAFDDGQGASVMDMMALHAPQPPPPGPKDLASFGALEKYYERANGFRTPGAELRQEYQSGPDGAVGKQHNVPGGAMLMTLLKHPDGYSRVPVPSLFIFANPHSLGAWVDNSADSAVRTAANAYSTALSALTQKQEIAVKSGLPTARVITIPHANHYVFLSNQSEVLTAMRTFMSTLH
jgi:pimeloyl-ACP methyl ester carboxylesterase